jgi:protein tyrosine/serine phosphatase
MHCKSGADRAGVMSVLYAHFRLGQPIRQALEQLSLRYLHMRAGKTGVLDYTFDRYLADAEPKGISFIDWVNSDAYDPAKMKAEFRAKWWGTLLTEQLIRRE